MAVSALVDSSFLVALLNRRDTHHRWAIARAAQHARPWQTCEAALSEAFHLLGPDGVPQLIQMLRRKSVAPSCLLANDCDPITLLMQKYSDVPMSLADACLVRMTETAADPIVLTTDSDFRVYRRHSRQTIPCELPG